MASKVENSPRIGLFICQCGNEISQYIDLHELELTAKPLPNVAWVEISPYPCSKTGLADIEVAIKEHDLDRIVVAGCTPRTHEPLFRAACEEGGLNKFLFDMVNIRDQCAWVHSEEKIQATKKAKDLIRMGVAKVSLLKAKEEVEIPVIPCALVIGGGISGMAAALSLARAGFPVKLVEKEKKLGGLTRGLYKLYTTSKQGSDLVEEHIEAVNRNSNIELFLNAEVTEISGWVGNYKVTISSPEKTIEHTIGVIILATGARLFEPEGLFRYDGKKVITQYQLEHNLLKGKFNAKNIVMIQCVGSRDETRPYCSRICCMTAVKNAILIKQNDPNLKVSIFFRDLQTFGDTYRADLKQAKELGVAFMRYDPTKKPEVCGKVVKIHDELSNENLEIPYDLVVLSTPLVSHSDAMALSEILWLPLDENNFFVETKVKLRPRNYIPRGIYLCGCCHWPADTQKSVFQAYNAASRAIDLLMQKKVKSEAFIVEDVDVEKCIGCGLCESLCQFGAIRLELQEGGKKAKVFPADCKGCGICGASCPQQAIIMQYFTNEELIAQVNNAFVED